MQRLLRWSGDSSRQRALVDGLKLATEGSRDVRRAGLAGRAGHVAAEAAGQHVDVVRAAVRFRPQLGSLEGTDAARGRELVRAALDGLEPRFVSNRRDSALGALDAVDGARLTTLQTTKAGGIDDVVRQQVRTNWERLLGKFGAGSDRGNTIYTSVQFTEPQQSLATVGAVRGAIGVRDYGENALELSDSIRPRLTIAARDSGTTPNPPRLGTIDQLDDIVLERLARTHGFTPDYVAAPTGTRDGVLRTAGHSDLQRDLLTVVRDMPEAEAVGAIRNYLTSPALTKYDQYIEAQIRGVDASDVAAVFREPLA